MQLALAEEWDRRTKGVPPNGETLEAAYYLSLALQSHGHYSEAEKIQRDSLPKLKESLGEEHPDTLTCLHGLTNTLRLQGKFNESESICREVLKTQKRVLGDDHDHTLNATCSLACILEE